MEDLFFAFLRAGIFGSVIIVLVLLLRLCLRKAPRQLICILWLLAAVRLLLPFSFESQLSLQPEIPSFSDTAVQQPVQRPDDGPVTDVTPLPPVSSPAPNDTPVTPPATAPEPPKTLTLRQILPILWLAGAGALAVYATSSCLLLKKRLRTAVRSDGVFLSDAIRGAFVMGYIKPKIYLPATVDTQDRAYIVAHEQAHIARGDHWWKLLGFVCLCLHWYNPLVWLSFVLFGRDTEVACDERVVWGMALEERKAYSMALLNCGKRLSGLTAVTLCFGKESLKQRIKNVLSYRKPGFWITAVAGMLAVAIAIFFLTTPKTQDPDPTDPTDGTTTPTTQGPTDGTTVPTTVPPTTQTPTTAPTDPTTVPPTTAPVETVPPTTAPPETVPPTTAPPVTEPPVTEPPVDSNVIASGNWASLPVYWKVTSDGVLTISGNRSVQEASTYVWSEYADIITTIIVEDGITNIPKNAFADMKHATSVYIGNKVEEIDQCAFYHCTSLRSVVFPDSLNAIERGAFSGCTSLERVTFSGGSLEIGDGAFANCTGLKELLYTPNCGLKTIGEGAFRGSGLVSFVAPPSLRTIDFYAFEGCLSLETVILEGGIKEVYAYSFQNCSSLKTLVLGESITGIHNPFFGCKALERIELYTSGTFEGTDKLTALKTLIVGGKAFRMLDFSGCTALESVTIDVPLKEIPANAFNGCTSLTAITLPDTVTNIDNSAFRNSGLREIVLPASLQIIGMRAFENTYITEIIIPSQVQRINSAAFMNCPLKTITFLGDAPEIVPYQAHIITDGAFKNVTATVYYPGNNSTWTEDKRLDYGGTLTWVAVK